MIHTGWQWCECLCEKFVQKLLLSLAKSAVFECILRYDIKSSQIYSLPRETNSTLWISTVQLFIVLWLLSFDATWSEKSFIWCLLQKWESHLLFKQNKSLSNAIDLINWQTIKLWPNVLSTLDFFILKFEPSPPISVTLNCNLSPFMPLWQTKTTLKNQYYWVCIEVVQIRMTKNVESFVKWLN